MNAEIIHHKKNHRLTYTSIVLFTLDRYTKVLTVKTWLARCKGSLISRVKAEKEIIRQDRFNLLRLWVSDSIHQRPSRASSGYKVDDIISMLYGKLWFKHINNAAF